MFRGENRETALLSKRNGTSLQEKRHFSPRETALLSKGYGFSRLGKKVKGVSFWGVLSEKTHFFEEIFGVFVHFAYFCTQQL